MCLKFCLTFAFCISVLCVAYLFCMRVWFIQHVEKLDPVNVVKPPKKITALSHELREERIQEILGNG